MRSRELNHWHVSQGTVTRKPHGPVTAPVFEVAVAKGEALAGWIAQKSDEGRSFEVAGQLTRTSLEIAGATVFGTEVSASRSPLLESARISMKSGLTRQQVAARMNAGHEQALCWALCLLSKHPLARARVEQELAAEVCGKLTLAAVERLGYLGQVVNEVLRMHPIPGAPLAHRAWANPQAFDPSRFAGDKRQSAAHLELVTVLATVLRQVRVDVRPGFVANGTNGLEVRARRRAA